MRYKPGSLKHWRAKYDSFLIAVKRRATARRYSQALEAFFSRYKDRATPDSIFAMDVEDYKVLRKNAGVADRTINYEINVVRTFYNWLIRVQQVPTFNPAAKVKFLRVPEKPRRAMPRETVDALLVAAAKDPKYNLFVRLVLTTGMRSNEMAALRWSWIDFEQGMIYLPGDVVKSWRGRELPLREDVLALLKAIAPTNGKDEQVFKNWADNPDSAQRRWKVMAKRIGQPRLGIHQARRAFATYLHRAGADLLTVQTLLGHRNIKTTVGYMSAAETPEIKKLVSALPF